MADKIHLLLAEDDENLGFLTKELLESEGYAVTLATDGQKAAIAFHDHAFDLCILDVMMPVKDGFTLAAEIRKINPGMPCIFLTARAQKSDKEKGFTTGADDYITKPFDEEELLWRVKAVLRRFELVEADNSVFKIGKFTFNHTNQELTLDGTGRRLTEKEADILKMLCMEKNKVVRRETVLLSVWGVNDYFLGRSLDVFITKLRKYLKEDERVRVENVHGVGFCLRDE